MKQCETCINREYKDDLICCMVSHSGLAFRELLKHIPFFGKDISDYECHNYEMDREKTENVIDFEANLPHEACELMCWHCGHRYIGVFPEQTLLKQLECPHCRRTGHMFKTGQTVERLED